MAFRSSWSNGRQPTCRILTHSRSYYAVLGLFCILLCLFCTMGLSQQLIFDQIREGGLLHGSHLPFTITIPIRVALLGFADNGSPSFSLDLSALHRSLLHTLSAALPRDITHGKYLNVQYRYSYDVFHVDAAAQDEIEDLMAQTLVAAKDSQSRQILLPNPRKINIAQQQPTQSSPSSGNVNDNDAVFAAVQDSINHGDFVTAQMSPFFELDLSLIDQTLLSIIQASLARHMNLVPSGKAGGSSTPLPAQTSQGADKEYLIVLMNPRRDIIFGKAPDATPLRAQWNKGRTVPQTDGFDFVYGWNTRTMSRVLDSRQHGLGATQRSTAPFGPAQSTTSDSHFGRYSYTNTWVSSGRAVFADLQSLSDVGSSLDKADVFLPEILTHIFQSMSSSSGLSQSLAGASLASQGLGSAFGLSMFGSSTATGDKASSTASGPGMQADIWHSGLLTHRYAASSNRLSPIEQQQLTSGKIVSTTRSNTIVPSLFDTSSLTSIIANPGMISSMQQNGLQRPSAQWNSHQRVQFHQQQQQYFSKLRGLQGGTGLSTERLGQTFISQYVVPMLSTYIASAIRSIVTPDFSIPQQPLPLPESLPEHDQLQSLILTSSMTASGANLVSKGNSPGTALRMQTTFLTIPLVILSDHSHNIDPADIINISVIQRVLNKIALATHRVKIVPIIHNIHSFPGLSAEVFNAVSSVSLPSTQHATNTQQFGFQPPSEIMHTVLDGNAVSDALLRATSSSPILASVLPNGRAQKHFADHLTAQLEANFQRYFASEGQTVSVGDNGGMSSYDMDEISALGMNRLDSASLSSTELKILAQGGSILQSMRGGDSSTSVPSALASTPPTSTSSSGGAGTAAAASSKPIPIPAVSTRTIPIFICSFMSLPDDVSVIFPRVASSHDLSSSQTSNNLLIHIHRIHTMLQHGGEASTGATGTSPHNIRMQLQKELTLDILAGLLSRITGSVPPHLHYEFIARTPAAGLLSSSSSASTAGEITSSSSSSSSSLAVSTAAFTPTSSSRVLSDVVTTHQHLLHVVLQSSRANALLTGDSSSSLLYNSLHVAYTPLSSSNRRPVPAAASHTVQHIHHTYHAYITQHNEQLAMQAFHTHLTPPGRGMQRMIDSTFAIGLHPFGPHATLYKTSKIYRDHSRRHIALVMISELLESLWSGVSSTCLFLHQQGFIGNQDVSVSPSTSSSSTTTSTKRHAADDDQSGINGQQSNGRHSYDVLPDHSNSISQLVSSQTNFPLPGLENSFRRQVDCFAVFSPLPFDMSSESAANLFNSDNGDDDQGESSAHSPFVHLASRWAGKSEDQYRQLEYWLRKHSLSLTTGMLSFLSLHPSAPLYIVQRLDALAQQLLHAEESLLLLQQLFDTNLTWRRTTTPQQAPTRRSTTASNTVQSLDNYADYWTLIYSQLYRFAFGVHRFVHHANVFQRDTRDMYASCRIAHRFADDTFAGYGFGAQSELSVLTPSDSATTDDKTIPQKESKEHLAGYTANLVHQDIVQSVRVNKDLPSPRVIMPTKNPTAGHLSSDDYSSSSLSAGSSRRYTGGFFRVVLIAFVLLLLCILVLVTIVLLCSDCFGVSLFADDMSTTYYKKKRAEQVRDKYGFGTLKQQERRQQEQSEHSSSTAAATTTSATTSSAIASVTSPFSLQHSRYNIPGSTSVNSTDSIPDESHVPPPQPQFPPVHSNLSRQPESSLSPTSLPQPDSSFLSPSHDAMSPQSLFQSLSSPFSAAGSSLSSVRHLNNNRPFNPSVFSPGHANQPTLPPAVPPTTYPSSTSYLSAAAPASASSASSAASASAAAAAPTTAPTPSQYDHIGTQYPGSAPAASPAVPFSPFGSTANLPFNPSRSSTNPLPPAPSSTFGSSAHQLPPPHSSGLPLSPFSPGSFNALSPQFQKLPTSLPGFGPKTTPASSSSTSSSSAAGATATTSGAAAFANTSTAIANSSGTSTRAAALFPSPFSSTNTFAKPTPSHSASTAISPPVGPPTTAVTGGGVPVPPVRHPFSARPSVSPPGTLPFPTATSASTGPLPHTLQPFSPLKRLQGPGGGTAGSPAPLPSALPVFSPRSTATANSTLPPSSGPQPPPSTTSSLSTFRPLALFPQFSPPSRADGSVPPSTTSRPQPPQ